jgi:hypothetical protein
MANYHKGKNLICEKQKGDFTQTQGVKVEILEAKKRLKALEEQVSAGTWGSAKPWGGADVGVVKKAPIQSRAGFYPDPRYVETTYVGELSWLFEKVRDIFNQLEYFGAWKEELFGRLGNMADRAKEKISPLSCQSLLLAVLHECFAIAEEMETGEFRHLMVTSGNVIFDDLLEEVDRDGYLGTEATRAYFAANGIEL